MRRPTTNSRGGAAEANMTPMIDVVFLLIIFFLVSSHLARRESRLQLDLPTATTSQAEDEVASRLTIHVEANGSMRLGVVPVTPAELVARLTEEVTTSDEPPRVRLRGDRDADFEHVEPALAACAEAGVVDIALAVYGSRGTR